MKLIRLLESSHADLWDKLASYATADGNDSTDVGRIVDFIAGTYNGGLAETILLRDVTFDEFLLSLENVERTLRERHRTVDISKLTELIGSLSDISDTVKEYVDDFRDASSSGDGEGSQDHILSLMAENPEIDEMEDWIYNNSNMDPVLAAIIATVNH